MSEALGDIRNLAFVYNHVLEEEIPAEWLELLARLDEEESSPAASKARSSFQAGSAARASAR